MTEVIKLIQQPIVQERLREISDKAKAKCEYALSLACTSESYKEIKKIRAELNRDFAELEECRKGVENTVKEALKPFEDTYKELITLVYKETDAELKSKIESVTSAIAEDIRCKVKEYFDEKAMSVFDNNVPEFVSFEASGITVNMSTSVTKAKKDADAFIEARKRDVDYILSTCDAQLYIEYAKCLDLAKAQLILNKRHEEEAQSQSFMQTFSKAREEVKEHTNKVEKIALKAPTEVEAVDITPQDILETTFTVRGTIEQLHALKIYMIEKGIEVI